jgi:N-formylglutamate deformylase
MIGDAGAVEVLRPQGRVLPILFSSPHSGRNYPGDFGTIQPMSVLRRAEDAFVDDLIRASVDQGVTIVNATFPRAYLDVNREEDDLDPDLIQAGEHIQSGEKSRLGIGLIRRVVTPEFPIYDRLLSIHEVNGRIEKYYRPYHRAIADSLDRLHSLGWPVVFIDWHSMKSVGNAATPDGPGVRRPDVVIGDLFGTSCSGNLTEAVESYLRNVGLSVSVNTPYAGAATLRRYGKPDHAIHAFQIEMNREIYLNEETVELKPEGVARLTEVILGLVPVLASWCRSNN